MGSIVQTRQRHLSLWQSAVDQVNTTAPAGGAQAVGGTAGAVRRPDMDNRMVEEAARFISTVEDLGEVPQPNVAETQAVVAGVGDNVVFCSNMALKVAEGLISRIFKGDSGEIARYKAELREKFGPCDVKYAQAAILYAEFVASGGIIPYRGHKALDDYVITDKLRDGKARIGIVGDWGTGQTDALHVLRLMKNRNPDVAIHLGDIYYSGTQHEVDDYFLTPWRKILDLDAHPIPTYTLSGNHDMYSGGAAYYALLDKLGQPASYFCLRNKDWQVIAIDTGKNSNDGGPTHLEETEMLWLIDKLQNFGGRTILLSHHQLFSAYEDVEGHSGVNSFLLGPLTEAGVLPKVDLWLWGHEHNLVVYDEFVNVKRARCVGCSAFPVGVDEDIRIRHDDVPVIKDASVDKGDAFYQHAYAIIDLDGASATVSYYQDTQKQGRPDELIFQETI